ncbi:MAG: hypothetical protein KatS3mg111_1350 [Pirellulaceae bacterium]|nr:MAG: hypothetical protein KatS3mg111_1350 [Pirellulaceae bacterium]
MAKTWLMFGYSFGSAGAYVTARTLSDSEFLSQIGAQELPEVYLASAGAVAFTSAIYARITRQFALLPSVLGTQLLLAMTSILLALGSQFDLIGIEVASLFLITQIRGSLGTIQLGMLINDQFSFPVRRQVIGRVLLGATSAGFLFGVATGVLTTWVSPFHLLWLIAAIDLATALPVFLLGSKSAIQPTIPADHLPTNSVNDQANDAAEPENADAGLKRQGGTADSLPHRFPRVHRPLRHYTWAILFMVGTAVVVNTLVELQWKTIVSDALHANEHALALYFGIFYAVLYLATGTFQYGVTAVLIKRLGVVGSLLLFPVMLLIAIALIPLAAAHRGTSLLLATWAKGNDVFKRSATDPAVHLLFAVFPPEQRHRALTLSAGIVKPLCEALTAALLILTGDLLPASRYSLILFLLIPLWVVAIWRVGGLYRALSPEGLSEPLDPTET